MNPLSIVFIEPRGRQANVFEYSMNLPLMGSLILGTILSRAGHRVQILNENILQAPVDPLDLDADIVCLSCLTLNANRGMDLARAIRLNHPRTRILIGGIHASLVPEDFLELADQVVTGEGESVILDVVEGRLLDRVVHGKPVEDLDTLPVIDYSLLKGAESMSVIPVMTSRGCPFDCNFCTVTRIFGRRYRKQSPERILAELRNALVFFKGRNVFFYDDNLAVDVPRLDALMEGITAENMGISWSAQVRADIARDPELVARMYRSGCNRVYIGFESIDDQSLKALHKSQTRADVERAVAVIHEQGIQIHGMFIFGEDHDTTESFARTADFAVRHDVDTVQFMILTPFPGTRIYEKLVAEGRLLHRNWDFYDGMHTVFLPMGMSPLELQEGALLAHRQFYSVDRSLCDIVDLVYRIGYDALVWNFRQAVYYDPDNFVLKVGARFIISRFEKLNRSYFRYLGASPQPLPAFTAVTPEAPPAVSPEAPPEHRRE